MIGLARVTQTLNVGTAVGTGVGDINASGNLNVTGGINVGTATGATAGQMKASAGMDLAGSKFVVDANGSLTKINNVALGNWPANAAGYFKNNGAGVLSWATVQHSELGGVTADQHHAQAHTLASHSTKAHTELTGVTADQHHAQSHTHASHTSIGADDHHAEHHAAAHKPSGGDPLAGYTFVPIAKYIPLNSVTRQSTGTETITLATGNVPALAVAVSVLLSVFCDEGGVDSNWYFIGKAAGAEQYLLGQRAAVINVNNHCGGVCACAPGGANATLIGTWSASAGKTLTVSLQVLGYFI